MQNDSEILLQAVDGEVVEEQREEEDASARTRRQLLFGLTVFACICCVCLVVGVAHVAVDHFSHPIVRHELDHTIYACPGSVVIQHIADITLYTGCIFSVGSPNASLQYKNSCDEIVIAPMPDKPGSLDVVTYSAWYRTYHVIRLRLFPKEWCGGSKMVVQTIEPEAVPAVVNETITVY